MELFDLKKYQKSRDTIPLMIVCLSFKKQTTTSPIEFIALPNLSQIIYILF